VFIRFSVRVSAHLIGRRSWREIQGSRHSSGYTGILQPKPPPTSGATTRMRTSEMPRHCASCCFTRCGTWVEVHTVSFCGPSSQWASTARGSIETGATFWFKSTSFTTPSASLNSFSTSAAFAAGTASATLSAWSA